MNKGVKIGLSFLALGGVLSLTGNVLEVFKKRTAEQLYQEKLAQAVSEASHARLVCRLDRSNQELKRLKEAMKSDNPAATYQTLEIFPFDACSENVAEKELAVSKLQEFKNHYVGQIKKSL
ncbi:hypothetical protein M610_gp118 [Alteromonas phage vB_AmaP_AD45-P1]|uniref:hypothetical protein n=1 Tax=Alteromonas phage vB_AmaP_AD45-P1 TaxID=1300004 RepID=UPI0003334BFA|nr:hypothetical protein M610_gp118 [Alteromonas phage vB_AmaP_AD45-P1]AGM46881.1 hypothetical protein AD45P1_00315 [Alteromonas phage vB_AmaP_AD45-P1]